MGKFLPFLSAVLLCAGGSSVAQDKADRSVGKAGVQQ
jgi:hypothetical protein